LEIILETKNGLLVHLGCFDQPVENWYNTDITPHIWISRVSFLPYALYRMNLISSGRYGQHRRGVFKKIHYLNLKKKLPFKDDSVNAFFSSHVIEHLYIHHTESLLREILRTLVPGGSVRFVLPDLEYCMRLYDPADPRKFLETIFENTQRGLEKNQHKWMYTAPYLIRLLKETGFSFPCQREYQKTDFIPFIPLDNRPENSFYVEARKP